MISVALQALAVFADAGAIVEEAAPDLAEADQVFRQMRAFDYEFGWGELVRSRPDLVKSEVIENVALGAAQTGADLQRLARARTRLEGRTREYFDRFDLWLTPTVQTVPFPIEERWPTVVAGEPMGDYLDWMRSVCVVSAMGTPAISIPAGFTKNGLPVGIQLVAPHRGERTLLRAARAYEERTLWAGMHPELPG